MNNNKEREREREKIKPDRTVQNNSLYFRVQYLPTRCGILWYLRVPPGGARAEQKHSTNTSTKFKKKKKKREKHRGGKRETEGQIGGGVSKWRMERRGNIIINTLYFDRKNIFFSPSFFDYFGLLQGLLQQRPEWKHEQIRHLLHLFTCAPPQIFTPFFIKKRKKDYEHLIWHDFKVLLAKPTPFKKH